MSELEEKLGNILSDPNMMQQIMGMAKMLSASQQPQQEPQQQESEQPTLPPLDPKLLQALSGMANHGGVDKNQQFLLKALQPYLSRDRISKLERAMGAARMASTASAFLGAGGIRLLSTR